MLSIAIVKTDTGRWGGYVRVVEPGGAVRLEQLLAQADTQQTAWAQASAIVTGFLGRGS